MLEDKKFLEHWLEFQVYLLSQFFFFFSSFPYIALQQPKTLLPLIIEKSKISMNTCNFEEKNTTIASSLLLRNNIYMFYYIVIMSF